MARGEGLRSLSGERPLLCSARSSPGCSRWRDAASCSPELRPKAAGSSRAGNSPVLPPWHHLLQLTAQGIFCKGGRGCPGCSTVWASSTLRSGQQMPGKKERVCWSLWESLCGCSGETLPHLQLLEDSPVLSGPPDCRSLVETVVLPPQPSWAWRRKGKEGVDFPHV